MCILDIILATIIVVSFLYGLFRGFIKELAGLVGVVVGVYGAIHFSHWTESLLADMASFEGIGVVAFATTLMIIVIGVHFLAIIIDKIVGITILSIPNRVLGGVFSVAKSIFFTSCIISVISFFSVLDSNLISSEQKKESILYAPIADLAPRIFPLMNFDFEKMKDWSSDFINK